jgi:hypothetical protein
MLESITLASKIAVDIDFGIDARPEYADGEVWPSKISIFGIAPQITFRGIDPTWLAAAKIPILGRAVTHVLTSIALRKREIGGTFAVGGGITFTAAGLAHVSEAFTGGAPGETEVILRCRHDGTNAPLIVTLPT